MISFKNVDVVFREHRQTVNAVKNVSFDIEDKDVFGIVGGSGLGDFAYRYGYQRYRSEILMVCVVILIVLVQLIQTAGDFLVKRISRR